MYKQTLHTSEQIMRIEGAPRYHISTVLQTPPAFLVLSSHAYSALGRFLICFQGNHLYLWFFFFALVCCSLYACRLRFACLNWFLPKSSPIFGRKWIIFSSSCHHVALSWRSCYNWVFFWFKKCALHFHTSVGSSLCLFSYGQVRRKNHVLVSKFEPFDHPLADALDLNHFLRMLVYVIARKHKTGFFLKKSFQLGFFLLFFLFHSQYWIFFRLFWNLTYVRIQFQRMNFVKIAH